MKTAAPLAIWLADVDTTENEQNQHVKKMAALTQANFPVPPGFVITEHAYFQFLRENKLDHKIKQMLSTIAVDRPDSLMQGEHHISKLFAEASFSDELLNELLSFYDALDSDLKIELHATGRHQVKHFIATAETDTQFVENVKAAWATMFSSQALWHRHHQDLSHMQTGAVILVQVDLPLEKAGQAMTIETKTHAKDKIVIKTQDNDMYLLSKKNGTILTRDLNHKTKKPKLTHDEILEITTYAKELEKHLYFPQEISWSYVDDELYILETKPISSLPEKPTVKKHKLPASRGTRITPTIGTGTIKIIHSKDDLKTINRNMIVVLTEAKPQDFKNLKKAKGIISESGHPQTEVATLLRKQGIPTIFNVKNATKLFKNGHVITVHADKGEIYLGGL